MGASIQKLIEHFGDQVKTAKALGVSQSAVSQWLSESSRMSALVALRAESETDGLFKAVDLCPALRGATKAA
ncbi:MAG: Cro/CI family transcriptional regulator [Pseudomonadales bacterium]